MKVYKLQGKAKCVFCGEGADLYVDEVHITVCRKCGVALYKNLGEHFVPRAVPNVIMRSEKQYRPLSTILTEEVEENQKDTIEETIIFEEKQRKTKDIFRNIKTKFKHFFKVNRSEKERL